MKDNRGQTLAELLIAFAISAIILAALSYLLFTGLRLYDRNDVNARVQNETQNVSNLLKDSVMAAEGICVDNDAPADMQCVLLGKLFIQAETGGYSAYFAGEAVATQLADDTGNAVGEMYLIAFPHGDGDYGATYTDADGADYARLAQGAASEAEAARAALDEVCEYLKDMTQQERRPWLLAEHVTDFTLHTADSVKPEKETITYVDGSTEDRFYFTAPFGLTWKLSLSMQSQQGESGRVAEDTVYLRNRIQKAYVKQGGEMHAYLPR